MYERDMARLGRHLFRWRRLIPGTVIAAVSLAAVLGDGRMFANAALDAAHDAFWLLVALLGMAIRIVASGYAAPRTSGETRAYAEAETLNTTGFYSAVRHPLYFARLLTFAALGFLSGSWECGVIVVLVGVLVYERLIAFEEAYLLTRFGDAFSAWAAKVPALVPRFTGWTPSPRSFWARRAIWRETNKVFDIMLGIALLDGINAFVRTGVVELDRPLLWIFGAIAALRLVYELARRFFRFLDGVA